LLGERHAGGEHLDQRLTFAGGWDGPLLNDETVWLNESRDHDLGKQVIGGRYRGGVHDGSSFLVWRIVVRQW
jgi:hypothetical protein